MICKNVKECSKQPQNKFSSCKACRVEKTDVNICVTERKKRYNLKNPAKEPVVVFHMDGGIVRDEEQLQKCDYLFVANTISPPITIFVELKGRNVAHGLRQIMNSVEMYADDFAGSKILARLVCASVPRITNDRSVLDVRKKLKQNYHAELDIKEKSMDDSCLC